MEGGAEERKKEGKGWDDNLLACKSYLECENRASHFQTGKREEEKSEKNGKASFFFSLRILFWETVSRSFIYF